tara:strand:- start:65 stop:853 length:789 start_codon:yes stop_codon:yes gene_type:complete
MKGQVQTYGKPTAIEFNIEAKSPTKVYLMVRDKNNPKNQFTNRYNTVEGQRSLVVRMPIAPDVAEFFIKDENELVNQPPQYRLITAKKHDLKTKRSQITKSNKDARQFIEFAEEFVEKLPRLSAGKSGSIYSSNNGRYVIRLLDDIVDREGKEIMTPARISKSSKRIDVSKAKFMKYTVPMRMAILLHEMAHGYINKEASDETEADLNALDIYLNEGYPRIEAFSVFGKVFNGKPTEGNRSRYKILKKFIEDFELQNPDLNY